VDDGADDAVDVEVSSEAVDEEVELARRAPKRIVWSTMLVTSTSSYTDDDDSPHALVSIGDDERATRLDTSAAIASNANDH